MWKMNPLVEDARDFAERAHKGQTRKYTGAAYIVHPVAVAASVAGVGADDETVAAALLHDVLEDTGCTAARLARLFGVRVARIVMQVTNPSTSTWATGNRAARKRMDRLHLRSACPEAKTIKLADVIDNVESIKEHDPKFARVYLREKRLLLPFLREGNTSLYQIAVEILEGV